MKSVYTGGEKVAEFESYDELRVGGNKPAFIYEGNELVYPNPVKDGLVLWYDFSGRTNTDGQRGIAEDLSGNGNHGTLQNFNYTSESGYDKNKLLFDGVDDYIQVPETGLNPASMAVVDNGKIYSYEGDEVLIKRGDSEIEYTKVNLIVKKNLVNGFVIHNTGTLGYSTTHKVSDFIPALPDTQYILSAETFEGVSYEGGRAAFYNSTKDFIGGVYLNANTNTQKYNSFITPPDTRFLKVSIGNHVYNMSLIKSSKKETYSPSPKDFLTTDYVSEVMTNLLMYNRPLTPEEIAHNYAIEKERFGIE